MKKFKIIFFISSIIIICLLVFLFIRNFNKNENEKLSDKLMSMYDVTTLYSNTSNYSATLTGGTNTNIDNINSTSYTSSPFVIGIIKIDKIGINYPILSKCNKKLLEISPCRFAGPMPNEIGNLCIAGHNYVDYKFFGGLDKLEIKDKIKIYDLNGSMSEYSIFKIYETTSYDMSCTNQNTAGASIVTLITCNNVSSKRLVVKAKKVQIQASTKQ